jgi:hypothetical protein
MAKPRRLDFEMRRGDTAEFSFESVIRNEAIDPDAVGYEVPIDLTAGGTAILMTAKRERTDASPFFSRSIGSGVTVDSPASANKNWATIRMATSNTSTLTVDTDLVYDVQVTLPDGRVETMIEGLIAVKMDVG